MHDFEQSVESHRSYEINIFRINRLGWCRIVFFVSWLSCGGISHSASG